MSLKLRSYQQEAINSIEAAWASGHRSVCHQSPTGSGKSIVFRKIIENHHKSKKVIYVIAHRKNLVKQMSGHLEAAGVRHGLIMSGNPYIRYRVQACSIQTLVSRLDNLPEPDLLIYDEGHHATAKQFVKPILKWPNAKVLLETATPSRPDGNPLSDIADHLILGPEPQWLIDNGFLSDFEYFAPPGADVSGSRSKMGDYVKSDILEKVDKRIITGNVIDHYREHSDRLPAIAACVSIDHSEHVAREFRDAGYKSIAVHSKMRQYDIERAIKGLSDGSVDVLCNADLLGEGIDIPSVTTLIGLRPTQSQVIFLQHCGRVLRISPGKEKAIILDHVGNWERFGLPSDHREWSLSGRISGLKEIASLKKCPECYHPVPISSRVCEHCGHQWTEVVSIGSRLPEEKAGHLVKIKRDNNLILTIARTARNFNNAIELAGNYDLAYRIWTHELKLRVDTVRKTL